MRKHRILQLSLCVIFGLALALVQAGPPAQDHWVPSTYTPPEASANSNCGSGYMTCGQTADIGRLVRPYCCLEWQTSSYNPYCEQYLITRQRCASGKDYYSGFAKDGRLFNGNCGTDNACY